MTNNPHQQTKTNRAEKQRRRPPDMFLTPRPKRTLTGRPTTKTQNLHLKASGQAAKLRSPEAAQWQKR